MADYDDFSTMLMDWGNRQDWSPTMIAQVTRMAEEKFNNELRIDRMIQFDEGLVTTRGVELPDDWLEMDLVRVTSPQGADGFLPIHYKARDEFFRSPDKCTTMNYTIEGRVIFFGGIPDPINGVEYKIAYYGEVPVFTSIQPSWVYTKYPTMYLHAALMHANIRAIGEDGQVSNFKQLTEDAINKLNNAHLRAKASGSRVVRTRIRSFG